MGRTGCCRCCGCTVNDSRFDDPDGTNVIELWTQQGVEGVTETSTQNVVTGTTFTCGASVVSPKPPCRELAIVHTQTRTNVIEYRLGFVLSVTGTNSLPGISGAAWSGAFNCNGGRGSSNYTNGSIVSPFPVCDISGSVTTVTAHFYFGALEGAVYQATVGDATMPLDVTRTPITVSLVSQHDPGLNWPAMITLQPSLPLRQGQDHGVRWWRLYPGLATFNPDGSDPELRLCYDSYTLAGAYATSELDSLPPDPTTTDGDAIFFLAMQQGSHLAYGSWLGTGGTTGPNDSWYHHDQSPSLLSAITWREFTGNPLISEQVFYVPDVSPGADPIVFGIHHGANASAATKGLSRTVRLDNVCIKIKI